MIEHAALTDQGRKRKNNQDAFGLNPDTMLLVVADGMGGHAAGETASELTVKTIDDFVTLAATSRELTWPFGYDVHTDFEFNVLKTAVRLANARVRAAADEEERYSGMGSTAVVVWIYDGEKVVLTHVGDSRIYLWRDGQLRRLTDDHSLVQEQLKLGMITEDQVRNHAFRHVVTQAIGSKDHPDVDVQSRDLLPGDLLLLCCDGLTDQLEDSEIAEILSGNPGLSEACRELIQKANEAGGEDNITVALVRRKSD